MQRVVQLRKVSKCFWVTHEKPALVRAWLPRLIQPPRSEALWALREIDLELAPGTALGVLGPNGAGKTTLLSVVAGITEPTSGTVRVHGRVAPLLGLGSGFHPELTGLENIFLNGSLLGMTTSEVRRKLEAIVAFSQLDGFIDAPLATYSSGMQLRLGFAIAVHSEFDLLVVDEVLRVGDAAFQARCLERLLAFKRAGKTLLLTAQGADALRPLVDRALLLHQGRILAEGSLNHVQERYHPVVQWLAPVEEPLSPVARLGFEEQVARHHPEAIRHGWGLRIGTGEAQIDDVRFEDGQGRRIATAASGDPLTVAVQCTILAPLDDPHLGIAVFREDGAYGYGPNTRMDGCQFQRLAPGTYVCRLRIEALRLTPGRYRLSVAVWDPPERSPYAYHIGGYPLEVTGAPAAGVVTLEHEWRLIPGGDGEEALRVIAEGPRGRQAWFRTFEPLALTASLPPCREAAPTLRAECRGPREQLVWASAYQAKPGQPRHRAPAAWLRAKQSRGGPALPHRARGRDVAPHGAWCQGGAPRYQIRFPELALLTGWYQWIVGWTTAEGALSPATSAGVVTEVLADRLDHGIVYLPHRWELEAHTTPLSPQHPKRFVSPSFRAL